MSTTDVRTSDAWWQVRLDDLDLLSPVTTPCRVVAQMTNDVSHVLDSGMAPKTVPLTFFRKASDSTTNPTGDAVRPAHVRLLDHEVELGLVIDLLPATVKWKVFSKRQAANPKFLQDGDLMEPTAGSPDGSPAGSPDLGTRRTRVRYAGQRPRRRWRNRWTTSSRW